MRPFNYSKIKEEKWNSEILGLIAAIYKFAGKQELYLKQRPDELEKLVEIAKIQNTEASNAIEGIEPIQELSSWWRRRPHQRMEMKRKSQDTVMYKILSMRVLI